MRQPRRTAAEIPQARFAGARWTVAMCNKVWPRFCDVPTKANLRLSAILEQFCEHGDANCPPGWFRRVPPDSCDAPGAELAAFEACGVVLHGRLASVGLGGTFFVTRVTVDATPDGPLRRRGRAPDERQGQLPLRPGENG